MESQLIHDSLGTFRRGTVNPAVAAHESKTARITILWDYQLHGETATPARSGISREGQESALLVSAIPFFRRMQGSRKIGEFLDVRADEIFERYGERACTVCREAMPQSIHKTLNETLQNISTELLLLALYVDPDRVAVSQDAHQFAEFFSLERVITKDGRIIRVSNEEGFTASGSYIVLDTARPDALLANRDQFSQWESWLDQCGILELFASEDRATSQHINQLLSGSYCSHCRDVRRGGMVEYRIGTLFRSALSTTSLADLNLALLPYAGNGEVKGILEKIGHLSLQGLGNILYGAPVSGLSDADFLIWQSFEAVKNLQQDAGIYLEGMKSDGVSIQKLEDSLHVLSGGAATRVVSYDVIEDDVPLVFPQGHSVDEAAIQVDPCEGTRFDSLASLSGILDCAAPLYAATRTARLHGFSKTAFGMNGSGELCTLCGGTGVEGGGRQLWCRGCSGARFLDEVCRVEYYDVSFGDLLLTPLDDLIHQVNDPDLHALLKLLLGMGFSRSRLTDSWTLFDKGERSRLALVGKLSRIKNRDLKKQRLYSTPYLSWGLGMQGIQNAVESLLEYCSPHHRIYTIDTRPVAQEMLNGLMKGD